MFNLGKVVMTRGVHECLKEGKLPRDFINNTMFRYINEDWGDLCEEDWKLNDDTVKFGKGRIVASYSIKDLDLEEDDKIYVISYIGTIDDYTTILFACEY